MTCYRMPYHRSNSRVGLHVAQHLGRLTAKMVHHSTVLNNDGFLPGFDGAQRCLTCNEVQRTRERRRLSNAGRSVPDVAGLAGWAPWQPSRLGVAFAVGHRLPTLRAAEAAEGCCRFSGRHLATTMDCHPTLGGLMLELPRAVDASDSGVSSPRSRYGGWLARGVPVFSVSGFRLIVGSVR